MPNLTDYLKAGGQQSNAPGWKDQAPRVAPAGSGNDTVLQIYVPAEHTVLDYGAGTIPGIRMATDHHAHLTAGTPRTTISLGKAAGPSVSGSDGLNIFTAGAKTEEVMEYTFEHYHQAKQERVDGNWDEHCAKAKREETVGSLTRKVGGVVGDDFAKDYGLKVGGDYVQNITGEAQINTKGNCFITYEGNYSANYGGKQEDHYLAPKWDFHWGSKTSSFLGPEFSINAGAKVAIFAGVASAVNIGRNFNANLTIDMAFNVGISVTRNESVVVSKTFIGKNDTEIDLSTKSADVEKVVAKLGNFKASVANAAIAIMK